MSRINGDKARSHRQRKARQQRRERWRVLTKPPAPKTKQAAAK